MRKLCQSFFLLITFVSFLSAENFVSWQNDTTYQKDDIVSYNGSDWIAQRFVYQNTPPQESDNEWFWKVYPILDEGLKWQSDKEYAAGDTIFYDNRLWVAQRFVYQNTPPQESDNGWFWLVIYSEEELFEHDKNLLINHVERIVDSVNLFADTIVHTTLKEAQLRVNDIEKAEALTRFTIYHVITGAFDSTIRYYSNKEEWEPELLKAGYNIAELEKIVIKPLVMQHTEERLQEAINNLKAPTPSPMLRMMTPSQEVPLTADDMVEDYIEGNGNEDRFPELMEEIGVLPTNTKTYAATRNLKDAGQIYQYKIEDETLYMKRGKEEWEILTLPNNRTVINIAADNNRLFVLTNKDELWWYCVKTDQAVWSEKLMELGSTFEGGFIEPLTVFNYEKEGGEGIVTPKDYLAWGKRAHKGGSWTNLLSFNIGEKTFVRGNEINVSDIKDIAIGNWNGTVVTMYALTSDKVWFIDEELAHTKWNTIEKWKSSKIAPFTKNIDNSPYPLIAEVERGLEPEIDASNSVLAVTTIVPADDPEIDGNIPMNWAIYWIRKDYHNRIDFTQWDIDWTENSWNNLITPICSKKELSFRINTNNSGIHLKNGGLYGSSEVWEIPKPMGFDDYFSEDDNSGLKGNIGEILGNVLDTDQDELKGIMGSVPKEQISKYPVSLNIKVEDGSFCTYQWGVEESKYYSSYSDLKWWININGTCHECGEDSINYYFDMISYNAGALTEFYHVTEEGEKTKIAEYSSRQLDIQDEHFDLGKYPLDGPAPLIEIRSYWGNKWYGPIQSTNTEYFRQTQNEDGDLIRFNVEDAASTDRDYDDAVFNIYYKK